MAVAALLRGAVGRVGHLWVLFEQYPVIVAGLALQQARLLGQQHPCLDKTMQQAQLVDGADAVAVKVAVVATRLQQLDALVPQRRQPGGVEHDIAVEPREPVLLVHQLHVQELVDGYHIVCADAGDKVGVLGPAEQSLTSCNRNLTPCCSGGGGGGGSAAAAAAVVRRAERTPQAG